MADKYCVVRTDLLSGTTQGADLVSFRFYNGSDKQAEVENGVIVELGEYESDNREVMKAKAATSSSDLDKCAIAASPEIMYDERKRNLDEYINEAGKVVRGYVPRTRNIFSLTAEGFVSGTAPAKGGKVGIGTGGKLDAASSGFGECVRIEKIGRYTYYVIRVTKAAAAAAAPDPDDSQG